MRSESMMAVAPAAFPAWAVRAASIKRFVTPLMAETTATQRAPCAPAQMICAARAMHSALPTEVPPNFITCNRVVIALPS
jgi:hypothetical protein